MNKTLRTILLWILVIVVLIVMLYFLFRSPYSPIITQDYASSAPETPMVILWP
jgi:hypothetical protein